MNRILILSGMFGLWHSGASPVPVGRLLRWLGSLEVHRRASLVALISPGAWHGTARHDNGSVTGIAYYNDLSGISMITGTIDQNGNFHLKLTAQVGDGPTGDVVGQKRTGGVHPSDLDGTRLRQHASGYETSRQYGSVPPILGLARTSDIEQGRASRSLLLAARHDVGPSDRCSRTPRLRRDATFAG